MNDNLQWGNDYIAKNFKLQIHKIHILTSTLSSTTDISVIWLGQATENTPNNFPYILKIVSK